MASHGGDILYLCSFLCYVLATYLCTSTVMAERMGGRTLLVSGRRVLDHQNSQQQDKATMGEPSTHLIHLWTAAIQSGRHAVTQSTSSAVSADSFGGGAGVVSSSGAEQRSLCYRGTVFLHCMRWDNGNTPSIKWMSVGF
jgi:hypothetical protein